MEAEDVTLDDIWRLDLAKLDGWQCVQENTQGEEIFKQHLEADAAAASALDGKMSAGDDDDDNDSDDDDSSDDE